MEPIITSMLDDDLYKFTVQQAILELFPEAIVEYKFTNRSPETHKFNQEFLKELQKQINYMSQIGLTQSEYLWLKNKIPFFKPQYLEFLKNYKYNPEEVKVSLNKNNDLEISIKGLWYSTTLWEVKLMAIISEIYFEKVDNQWSNNNVFEEAKIKGEQLSSTKCIYADFGTRRRRSKKIHKTVLEGLKIGGDNSTLCGTSNVKFALDMGLKPIGTMSHEFIMGISALLSLRFANRFSMSKWAETYGANLGIFLTDTFGTNAFLNDFNKYFAMLFQGTRWDSGNWKIYTDKMISHYKEIGIDPLSKMIIYSDSLNVDKCIEINNYCKNKIKASFGVGTFFTNNGFKNSPALNMVIKMFSCNNIPVVKLSNSPGKVMGDPSAIRVAQWVFNNTPLDKKKKYIGIETGSFADHLLNG